MESAETNARGKSRGARRRRERSSQSSSENGYKTPIGDSIANVSSVKVASVSTRSLEVIASSEMTDSPTFQEASMDFDSGNYKRCSVRRHISFQSATVSDSDIDLNFVVSGHRRLRSRGQVSPRYTNVRARLSDSKITVPTKMFQYQVEFQPKVDSTSTKRKLLGRLAKSLNLEYAYDTHIMISGTHLLGDDGFLLHGGNSLNIKVPRLNNETQENFETLITITFNKKLAVVTEEYEDLGGEDLNVNSDVNLNKNKGFRPRWKRLSKFKQSALVVGLVVGFGIISLAINFLVLAAVGSSGDI